MKKVLILVLLALFFVIPRAKADTWVKYNRDSTGDVMPQNFYLVEMAKSSNGVRLFFGHARSTLDEFCFFNPGVVLSFDGTTWKDQTQALKDAGGFSDVQFLNMYADESGNIWSKNRGTEAFNLVKFDGTNWDVFSESEILNDIFPGGNPNGIFSIEYPFPDKNHDRIYTLIRANDDQRYLIYYNQNDHKWYNSGATGGPLDYAQSSTIELYGVYNDSDGSIWIWNRATDQRHAESLVGAWRLDSSGTWAHFGSSNGASDTITKLVVDSHGSVWAATPDEGVYIRDLSSSWTNWTKENSNIVTNNILTLGEDSSQRIWIMSTGEFTIDSEGNYVDDPVDSPGHARGISIYDLANKDWNFYTAKSGYDVLDNPTGMFLARDEVWIFYDHGYETDNYPYYALYRDDDHTTIFGQTAGDYVSKAGFDPTKKKKKTKTVNNKSVTIYKITKVKVRKKYKTKKTLVYKTGATQWYKALNLDTGKYQVVSKARGKRKHTTTINITSGEPYRLDLRY